jgi:hypothetical protein
LAKALYYTGSMVQIPWRALTHGWYACSCIKQ